MGAVWMRASYEMRSRWRALLSAAVLCGLFGAAVLALLAGARRTENAYPRFLERQRAYDLIVYDTSFFDEVFWKPDFEKLAKLPYAEYAIPAVTGGIETGGDFPTGGIFVGSADPRYARTMNRAVVVEGELPDPTRPDEVAVPYFAEGAFAGFRVGDRKRMKIGSEMITLTVVGRTAMPDELPPQPSFGWQMMVTPAFVEKYRDKVEFVVPSLLLRFEQRSDIARFERDVRPLTGGKILSPQEQDSHAAAVQSSNSLQASALSLLGLFTALTGAMIIGQLLARETAVGAEDAAILRAIGLNRKQLFRLGLIRVVPVAIAGAILSMVIGWLVSSIFPRGSVRVVDPTRGPVFDGLVLGIGSAAIAVAVMLIVLVPAWRAAATAGRRVPAPERPSTIASLARSAGMSIPAVAGARLALERGRGRTAVPVFSSLAVVAIGIASFVASTTFSASLQATLDQPELYGRTWDEVISAYDPGAEEPLPPEEQTQIAQRTAAALAADPDVAAVALADSGIPARVYSRRGPERGIAVAGLALMHVKGSLFSPIIEGHEPRHPDEVVLGPRMIRALGLRLDPVRPPTVEVTLQGAGDEKVTLNVVGSGVLPPLENFGKLGYGMMLGSEEALAPLVAKQGGVPPVTDLLVRWRPGANPKTIGRTVVARHKPKLPNIDIGEDISPGKFADVVSFGGVKGAPLAVGGVLAALGAAALAHVLITAIRRRRRDVAILKTLGFVRGQARRVVAWQATFTVIVATLVGVPLGILGGRWLWRQVADSIGVLPREQLAVLVLVVVPPAVVVLANLIAAFPARSGRNSALSPNSCQR